MTKHTLFGGLCVALALLVSAPSAEALSITPSSGVLGDSRWQDVAPTTNSTPAVMGEASALCGCNISTSTEVYKDESGGTNGAETITANVIGQTYLLVKDGNNFPAWYLFDLTELGWNGFDTVNLSGFWPGPGEISFVALHGGTLQVPEPATLSLIALGIFGLGAMRRRAPGTV
jgi:hypothetical protein